MSEALFAARVGDALAHTSMMADILGGVLEVAANVAIGVLATAAVVAATGITVATGGVGAFVLGAVVGLVVGVVMRKTGTDTGLSSLCEDIGNGLFPPSLQATISTGSSDTFINGIPAARAAGSVPSMSGAAGVSEGEDVSSPTEDAGFLDIAKGFFSQLWRPTVASPDPGAVPKPLDLVTCTRHPPMPPQFLAEGSDKVTINGQPAVRSGDRSTCDAKVVSSGQISPNVLIGGGKVVVREIRSGKTPGVALAVTALMMLKGKRGKFVSSLPCMLVSGGSSIAAGSATGALITAVAGSPNPVHSATGAKVLSGTEDLDFALPGILPIIWQRFYSSRDERRNGMFGAGWSVPYEVSAHIEPHPEGGDRVVYIDEQARRIDMGSIALGGAVFSAGEGLAVRRHGNGELLIESEDGMYRLFEPTLADASHLRLSQLGDRSDNRIYLNYDAEGRLTGLRDTLEAIRIEVVYSSQWPSRVERIERVFPDEELEVLTRYSYDTSGDLAEVRDASGNVQRRFAYDSGQRMVEHQLSTGLRCFYDWALIDHREWRVVHHWTDDGEEYRFDYDLQAGITRITDGMQRISIRRWNTQHQITEYTDNLGQTWRFLWNDERQLLGAVNPQGGQWQYTYDEAGNLCSTQEPMGRITSTLWLEHWSLPLIETDAAGQCWRYRYDSRGRCTHQIDPLGHVTQYRHDGRGLVTEIIDAAGNSQTLRWNEYGQPTERTDCSGYRTSFSYDRRGNLHCVTDALGERTTFSHDAQGRLVKTVLPEERFEQYQRDSSGLLTGYTDPAGHTTRFQYNRLGQMTRRIDVHNRQVLFGYDAYGRLETLTNENGESYRFAWDAGDRLVAQQDLDGGQKRYRYDALNNPVSVEQLPCPDATAPVPDVITHSLERDAAGRLTAKVNADGRYEYRYDALDQLTDITFTDLDGTQQHVCFTYDALGQLLTEKTASGTLEHHYDELGNLSQTRLPDERWINRLHYGSGHLHQINLDCKVICDFERDRLHREVLRTQGQINTRSHYDRSGRLRSRSRRPAGRPVQLPAESTKEYEYDPADNVISRLHRHRQGDQRTLLHYDATARILASQESYPGDQETFAYDAAANLLNGTSASAARVSHNKLLTYQDKRYHYDSFGRMIEKHSIRHGIQHFTYDAESRLAEVRSESGNVVRMTYDPIGRRIGKSEHNSEGILLGETRFVWDRLKLLQEHRHARTSLYLYTEDGYEPLARVDGTGDFQKIRYYHNDLSGLPEQLTEENGHPVWHARYHVWGSTKEEVREPYFIEEQNLRFQGQYLDRETGLHYNTFRFYDPDVGRFTTPDPIGLAGGINLYVYAPNPVGRVDPLGLTCSSYSGKLSVNASQMKPLERGSKAWVQAIKELRASLSKGAKFQVKVRSSSDALLFLKESQGGMNRYKAHTQSTRDDGISKYPKGYEQHMEPETGFGDQPHIKWYNNGTDGHIFYEIPN